MNMAAPLQLYVAFGDPRNKLVSARSPAGAAYACDWSCVQTLDDHLPEGLTIDPATGRRPTWVHTMFSNVRGPRRRRVSRRVMRQCGCITGALRARAGGALLSEADGGQRRDSGHLLPPLRVLRVLGCAACGSARCACQRGCVCLLRLKRTLAGLDEARERSILQHTRQYQKNVCVAWGRAPCCCCCVRV
jgi:hypothetical protein